MGKLADTTLSRKPDDLGAFAPLVEAIAAIVVARIVPLLAAPADAKVDRKSCGYSARWWDRNAGVTFEIFKDGRRKVAHKAAVDRAFEAQARLTPKAAPVEALDADELALQRAGIRLVGGGK